MRHRILAIGALAALLPAGAAFATAPDTTPADTTSPSDATSPSGTVDTLPATTVDDGAPTSAPSTTDDSGTDGSTAPASTAPDATPVPVLIFDGDRNPVATVTATDVELAWVEYGEDDAPDEGHQYVRVTVLVESETTGEDTFSINVDHFVLQDEHGALARGGNVRTAAQAEADEDAPGDAELASNEAVELALTFEIPAGVQPLAVFYLNDDRLFEIVAVDDVAASAAR